jgi:NADPH:quinone reductase-like Zn-dependent oxidoreductase
MKACEIPADCKSFEQLRLVTRADPSAGPGQILVRVRATSINARDNSVASGRYMGGIPHGDIIALSDGAGEVVSVGKGVSRFKPGDRVAGIFAPGWWDGAPKPEMMGRAATDDGMLAELVAMDEKDAVVIPAHLSYEEAATLPCAGVTAWHALFETYRPVRSGDVVLVQGSGGVSMFALQFARAAGATVIMTSSSDEKLARGRALGATHAINYRSTPEWDKKARELTGGHGVDCIVEVGGGATLPLSLTSVAAGGKITLIGVLSRAAQNPPLQQLMRKCASLHGIFVGSRLMFERMNAFIETHHIKPVVDRTFEIDATVDAFRHHGSGAHFGKIVIRV